jgi:hypothetical protein
MLNIKANRQMISVLTIFHCYDKMPEENKGGKVVSEFPSMFA